MSSSRSYSTMSQARKRPKRHTDPALLQPVLLIGDHTTKYKAPCECRICQQSFRSQAQQNDFDMRYMRVFSDGQAKALLANYVGDIARGQEVLRKAINQFGDHLWARWRKLSLDDRTALLCEMEPSLPADKDDLVEMSFERPLVEFRQRSQRRMFRLLPYLDVHILAKDPITVLGLIHARTFHKAADWAAFDHTQLTPGWAVAPQLEVDFNGGAVLMHGLGYGSLVSWEKEAAHRFDVVGFPRGRLILEAQATMIGFLGRIVRKLTCGLTSNDVSGAGRWNNATGSTSDASSQSPPWSSFVCQRFFEPPQFHLESMLAAAKSRLSATSDHLWLLQTEPAYFKLYGRKILQAEIGQCIKHDHGMQRATLIHAELSADIDENRFWQLLVAESEHLSDVYDRFRDSVTPGAALPKQVDRAFAAVEALLVTRTYQCSIEVYTLMSARPTFSHHYEDLYFPTLTPRNLYRNAMRENKLKDDRYAKQGEDRPGMVLQFEKERLWWIFDRLTDNPESERKYPLVWLLDMLNDHLGPDADLPVKLDEILYERLSNFITVMEMLQAIRLHRPRAVCDPKGLADTEDCVTWNLVKHQGRKLHTLSEIKDCVQLLAKFRNTPPPSGARNMSWLQEYNALHRTLSAYWDRVAVSYVSGFKRMKQSAEDIEFLVRPLKHWSHPEYINRLEKKRQQIMEDVSRSKFSNGDDLFLPLPSTDDRSTPTLSGNPKVKQKTRGETLGMESLDIHEEGGIEPPGAQSDTISVTKRSYATFRCMFPEEVDERQKHVAWDTFVSSMSDAGLSVSSTGGSHVLFEDVKSGKKMTFHRPHPDPTIDPIMLQSMGRRMNKHFKWTRETFVLKAKQS